MTTTTARSVALEALRRIDEGAYANLVLGPLLDRSGLDGRDRAFATDLVYGTTRMRRACDFLVDRFVYRAVDPDVRRLLRLGAYQLAFLHTPAHAAVGETVGEAPRRSRGFVNAVLRRVADAPVPAWPDDATRLSYPDWIVERLVADLGAEAALAALEQMDRPAEVTERADGYVQDLASQLVADAVDARPGDRIADLCAAPGGKATSLAGREPELVAAVDLHPSRARLVAKNAARLARAEVAAVVADARLPPFAPATFDKVLLDAPCSGLGVLRRRADARWRVTPADVTDLARLQRELLAAAGALVRPGGTLVYSVCTLTAAETLDVDAWAATALPGLAALAPPQGEGWEPAGRGARLLPQARGTDGMFVLRLAGEHRR